MKLVQRFIVGFIIQVIFDSVYAKSVQPIPSSKPGINTKIRCNCHVFVIRNTVPSFSGNKHTFSWIMIEMLNAALIGHSSNREFTKVEN